MIYWILASTLLISLYTDIRNRKILNIVTFPAMLLGVVYYTITLGFEGLLFSVAGLLVGFLLLIIPYLLGGMGAGDVKLLASVGALTGVTFVLHSFVYTALAGGVIALILLVRRLEFKKLSPLYLLSFFYLLKNITSSNDDKPRITFPYGVAITVGTLCTFFLGGMI
ncbi:A24 family peptidase [Guptibacillus algicola]|uniref:A24 family peptidase n=1 Tax=Guptibacillus algicola TaxID=225844 RepID=UPI001CD54ADC|nr:prepilin peptidase [Alkalihalobacillus algicola]MCA0987530.1 prepilin peptidase [Alkalihalobacillus algicola]